MCCSQEQRKTRDDQSEVEEEKRQRKSPKVKMKAFSVQASENNPNDNLCCILNNSNVAN